MLDVNSGSRLTLQPGTALYVWGDRAGGALGRPERRRPRGRRGHPRRRRTSCRSSAPWTCTVPPTAPRRRWLRRRCRRRTPGPHEASSRSATRACSTSTAARATSGCRRQVHRRRARAWSRLRESAGLVADNGTTMHAAAARTSARASARLLIRNDRVASPRGRPRRRQACRRSFVNRGPHRQARQPGTHQPDRGTSTYGDGPIIEKSGDRRLPRCSPREPIRVVTRSPVAALPSAQDPQVGLRCSCRSPTPMMRRPASSRWTSVSGRGAHRRPDEGARDRACWPTFADPAVIELRYDASLFTGPGTPPAGPGGPRGGARRGARTPPTSDIPNCCGPRGHAARRDLLPGRRSASRTEDGGARHGRPHHRPPAGGSSAERVSGASSKPTQLVNQRPRRVPSSSTSECRFRCTSTGGPLVMRECSPATRRGTKVQSTSSTAPSSSRSRSRCGPPSQSRSSQPRSTSAALSATRSTRWDPSTSTCS